MNDQNAQTVADALELLQLNQIAIASAVEELSLWVRSSGSPFVHASVSATLETLDQNAQALASAIRLLRQERP